MPSSPAILMKVEYLHPTLGIAFISWDPKLLGDTQLKSVNLAKDFIRQGNL